MVENEWKKRKKYLFAVGRYGPVHDRLHNRPIST